MEYIKSIKGAVAEHRQNGGWTVPVLNDNAEYDPFEIADINQIPPEDIHHMVRIIPNHVLVNGDWDAFGNGSFGPNGKYFLFKTIILCKDPKHPSLPTIKFTESTEDKFKCNIIFIFYV